MNVPQLPLNQLQRADSNVRKSGAAIEDLAASIEHHGLLQNLLVVERAGQPFVVAGGRRLQALQLLVAQGKLKDTHPVACKVVSEAEAAELSLAENTVRQAMHPADEFEAFSALARDHNLTSAEIAVRFGTTEKHVTQRMRLGNVAPELIAEYRAGNANLDQVMALAIVDDKAAQVKVWKNAGPGWGRQPAQLREALTTREIAATSVLGDFVGIEAYEAAGGTVRRDLFSDYASFPDSKLVNQLALARLEEEAAKLRAKGWGWVEARLEFPYAEHSKFRQQHGAKPDAKLGAVVTLPRYLGEKIRVESGLVKPGDKAPAQKKAGVKKSTGGGAGTGAREAKNQLLGIRTGAFRAALRGSTRTALAALAAAMVSADMFRHAERDPISDIVYFEGMGSYQDPATAAGLKISDPTGDATWQAWEKRLRAGAKGSSVFAYLLKQPEGDVLELLAVMVARNADTDNIDGNADDVKGMHQVAKLIGLDLAKVWSPTVEWLAKQSKDFILDAVAEAKDEAAAKPIEKMKLADMAAAALPILVASGWVPEPLRPPAPPKPKAPAKKAAKKIAKKQVAA